MNYSLIKKYDIANAKGINTSIFFCGCTHHCQGCFNASIWDFKCGKLFDNDAKQLLIRYLSDDEVKGLSILGGEPLQQGKELYDLIQEIETLFPDKKIWLYTGYKFDDIVLDSIHDFSFTGESNKYVTARSMSALSVDVLVDGLFKDELKDYHLHWRGSSNQKVINIQESLKQNKIILWCE